MDVTDEGDIMRCIQCRTYVVEPSDVAVDGKDTTNFLFNKFYSEAFELYL